MSVIFLLPFVLVFACSPGTHSDQPDSAVRYTAVPPGTHPSLLFSAAELPKLRRRAEGTGLPAEAWQRMLQLAGGDTAIRYEGEWEAQRLTAMALAFQITGDEKRGREAIQQMLEHLRKRDPYAFYEEVDSNFFETEHWPKAFAYAWDWLHEAMTVEERDEILAYLEDWCQALYDHTEDWWWRDASYNCGAIPVGALGLLCVSIQGETRHPEFDKWFESSVRRIRDNYFPTAWRANGICYEGPCYAQYHKNATQFGEALRRTGGPDIIKSSGAVNAMHYQTFQWMPQGGCGPIGDNTDYGRRVFAAAYLLGIGELRDAAALGTFEENTDRERLDPILTFLWYPDEITPSTPRQERWPTSYYFEISRNRAGYVYSRSEWDNEQAHYFAFVTRWAGANHQHYDMNSFLFHAFGEEFGTHRNIYSYQDPNHGADIEHNMVIVDDGGWPAHDRRNSAGDDCSTNGLMVGLGLGHFADYVRGDARESYRDNSVAGSCPALRADRTCLFVKQGPNPYLLVVDDIQQSRGSHSYDWQWYSFDLNVTGKGIMDDPFLIEGEQADCGIFFLEPGRPRPEFQVVRGTHRRRKLEMGLLKVRQQGSRVRYVALATAWEKGTVRPSVAAGPPVTGSPDAISLVVQGTGYSDLLVWQPEETLDGRAPEVTCGDLTMQGYLGLVRRSNAGEIEGYVLAEGGRLAVGANDLVRADGTVSVSADSERAWVTGQLLTRVGDGPVPARAHVRLPSQDAELYVDGQPASGSATAGDLVSVGRQN